VARKRRGVSWPLELSTFRWKRPPPSEGQKGGEAPPASPPTLLSYRNASITPTHNVLASRGEQGETVLLVGSSEQLTW
jgi:hypothetical protein